MYLVYIDDSGDTGFRSEGSTTDAFVLSALIIQDIDWLNILDEIRNFRSDVFQRFGLKPRQEIKATYLMHGNGPLRNMGMPFDQRMEIYKGALQLQSALGTIKVWAIVIDKHQWEAKGWKHIPLRTVAWENMIQRLERFTNQGRETCIVFPDEGHPKFVRAMFRKMRRISFVQSAYQPDQRLRRDATFITEDPNFRSSLDSYFIQLADLNSYAAYRHIFPKERFGIENWDLLGNARVAEVNSVRQLRNLYQLE